MFSLLFSQEPNNTPKKLINFFNKEMVHGKRFMQRDVSEVDENPAKVRDLWRKYLICKKDVGLKNSRPNF